MLIFTAAYFAAILAQIVIRAPYLPARREAKVDRRLSARERLSLVLLSFGLLLVPLVYATTSWLACADYRLPTWAGCLGVLLMSGSLAVFWRGHVDLGLNWSPTLEIRAHHELVTRGIYGVIRHPMYASLLLWALAQPLLLHNAIAGGLGPIVIVLFYLLRVGPEEQMMLDTFGDRYRAYMERVGGVVPRFGRRN